MIEAMAATFGSVCGVTPDVSLTNNYDNLDRLWTVGDNLLGIPNRTTYSYDQVGNLDQMYGTPATTASRVSRLTRETLYNASDAVAGTITHAYDAVGNRTARMVANFSPAITGLGNQTLAYDQRDLIDGDANPANANPWYDLNGNSLADETGAGTVDIYDAENRLIQRGSGIFLSYDANGNRVKKVTPSGTTYYLVDDRNPTGYAQVLAEYTSVNTSVAPTVTYTIGAELISQNRSGTVRYYGYDGQGSVRFLTDATISTSGGPATQITDTYDYEAYGMLLTGSGTTFNNYRYTGQQWDADLNMYYLRARCYQPGIGRFWTMDPEEGTNEDPLSLHKYLYCHADSPNKTDPSGNDPDLPSLMVVGQSWVYMGANFLVRATPALNRATVLLFEMTTGETVILGGSTAVGASAAMSKVQAGIGSWVQAVGAIKSSLIGTKAYLSMVLGGSGNQASHLNQVSAYTRINYDYGACVALRGRVFSPVTTEHREFHIVMEQFWSRYRNGGALSNRRVSNEAYLEALHEALSAVRDAATGVAKFAKKEIDALVTLAKEEQIGHGYHDGPNGLRPLVPKSTNVK